MLISLHRRAILASAAIVSRVGRGDLDRDTPCAGWTLADLLAHMTTQHYGFAAAAEGNGGDPGVWAPGPPAADPVAIYRAAVDRVLDAFAGDGVLDRPFTLPEISAERTFPGRQAVAFHLVDYVVHGWDVARSLGTGYELDPDVVDTALRIARAVPDGDARLAPDAAFAPAQPAPDGAAPLDQVVALLGRSPTWPR